MSHGWSETYDKGHNCKHWNCPMGAEACMNHNKVISACGDYLYGKNIDCFVCKDFEEDND